MTRQRLLTILAPALLLLGAAGAAHASPVFANTATTNASTNIAVTPVNGNSPLDGAAFVLLTRTGTSSPAAALDRYEFAPGRALVAVLGESSSPLEDVPRSLDAEVGGRQIQELTAESADRTPRGYGHDAGQTGHVCDL